MDGETFLLYSNENHVWENIETHFKITDFFIIIYIIINNILFTLCAITLKSSAVIFPVIQIKFLLAVTAGVQMIILEM